MTYWRKEALGELQGGDGSHHDDAGRVFELAGAYDVFTSDSDSESGTPYGSTAERLEPIVEDVVAEGLALGGASVLGGGVSGVAPAAVAMGGSELRPDIPGSSEDTGRVNLLETPEGRRALDGFLGYLALGHRTDVEAGLSCVSAETSPPGCHLGYGCDAGMDGMPSSSGDGDNGNRCGDERDSSSLLGRRTGSGGQRGGGPLASAGAVPPVPTAPPVTTTPVPASVSTVGTAPAAGTGMVPPGGDQASSGDPEVDLLARVLTRAVRLSTTSQQQGSVTQQQAGAGQALVTTGGPTQAAQQPVGVVQAAQVPSVVR
ncbi:uncharacterized protein IUM83_05795 [Phytophthora cinnamomi]|uniref:uncharacterized protein n=1 Tax=Phytophthora cinnamomi TaxID=4785 RepID=UPI00355ACD96|nr:hypothetical protein IUM83_05795 [Phytophthora cinnamomi]